jgi:hypothetical protein
MNAELKIKSNEMNALNQRCLLKKMLQDFVLLSRNKIGAESKS